MAIEGSINERISDIINFAIVNEAVKIQDEVLEKIFDEEEHTEVNKWDPNDLTHHKILIVAGRKRATVGNCFSLLKSHEAVSKFIKKYELQYGNDMWTRIGVDIAWDTLNGNFDYDLFAILCAVNGILGTKAAFKRITINRIRAAMNGYKKYPIYKEIIQSGNLSENNLSKIKDRTLYRKLDKLSDMNFFLKYTYKKRQTFYSTRIATIEELVESVCRVKSNRMRKRANIKSIEHAYGLGE